MLSCIFLIFTGKFPSKITHFEHFFFLLELLSCIENKVHCDDFESYIKMSHNDFRTFGRSGESQFMDSLLM